MDQPVGAGYSYSTDPRDLHHDEEGVSEDMYGFLQVGFFSIHRMSKKKSDPVQ